MVRDQQLGQLPLPFPPFLHSLLTLSPPPGQFAWKGLTKIHLLVLYVLAQFFFNFGQSMCEHFRVQ